MATKTAGRYRVDGALGGKSYESVSIALSAAITHASHAKVVADFVVRDEDGAVMARASRHQDGTVNVHRFDGAPAKAVA